MVEENIEIEGIEYPVVSVNTLVIGSGAAALNAALCLYERGSTNIAIVTEQWGGGTSNNAGSDKQTYYKLSMAGSVQDSPREMAKDLFNGMCMHGDIALCEAQHSAQAFFNLIKLGLPFPHDQYGGYWGYQTDHDVKGRATSAGPRTSHLMVEALSKEIQRKSIPVFNYFQIFKLLTFQIDNEKQVTGALAFDKTNMESGNPGIVIFNAVNIILGTGGPGGIYKSSVYPESQTGSTGLAFEIGAVGQNLTESQFGIASTKFRWNLSGTYQQVIPRYVSTDQKGDDEREFLNEHFPNTGKLCDAIFLKGYQWPFDPRKIKDWGSSIIDLLVYIETEIKNRRVYLDFAKNIGGEDFSFEKLGGETVGYLENSGALFGTPIERLKKMNPDAFQIFLDHNIDLKNEYLEIAVCAQHNNGGLKGNIWWESNVKHLFSVGEVNGTHGVYRPGGSALNAGQVGGMRAAMFISERYDYEPPPISGFIENIRTEIERVVQKIQRVQKVQKVQDVQEDGVNITKDEFYEEIKLRMSKFGGHIRNMNDVGAESEKAKVLFHRLKKEIYIENNSQLPDMVKLFDFSLTSWIYLEAIKEYLVKGGKSRGSYLVAELENDKPLNETIDEIILNDKEHFVNKHILEIGLDTDGNLLKKWVPVKPIPDENVWFEMMWKDFRERKIF